MKQVCWLFGMICISLPLQIQAQDKVLVFNNPTDAPFTTSESNGYMDIICSEVLARNGYKLSLVRLPAERGLRNVNEGLEDGDISRIAGLEKLYPNLIRIPERIIEMRFVGFTKEPQAQPLTWSRLKQYEVGYINGWKIFEANVPKGTMLVSLRDHTQLFEMFTRNRLQVILYSQYMGMAYARANNIKNIYPSNPPLAKKDMFMYVHKKHASLVPRFAATLKQLKQEGFVERVYNETIRVLDN